MFVLNELTVDSLDKLNMSNGLQRRMEEVSALHILVSHDNGKVGQRPDCQFQPSPRSHSDSGAIRRDVDVGM